MMNFLILLGTAFALAMDAFAVSIAAGVTLKRVGFRQVFRLSWHFGFFQALMPVLGWSAGLSFRAYIERFDHWLAFGLLIFVGGNMILEALKADSERKQPADPTRGRTLVLLSVATSIDALAVGLGLSLLKISIWFPALMIGIVAMLFTAVGLYLGKKLGASAYLSRYAEMVGGLVLIAISLNILREHGVFG